MGNPVIGMIGAFPYPHSQGSQVLVREQCRYLARSGFNVILFVYNLGAERMEGEGDQGVMVVRPPVVPGYKKMRAGPSAGKIIQDYLLYRIVRRAVLEGRVDVLHAHNYEAGLVASAAVKGTRVPWIYQPHGFLGEELPYYFSNRLIKKVTGWMGKIFDRVVPSGADGVVCMHDGLVKAMIKVGVEEEKILVVPPAVRVKEFLTAMGTGQVEGIDDSRMEHNSDKNYPDSFGSVSPASPISRGSLPPVVLYAGNLDAYQNLALLASAMAHVRVDVPDARLLVVTESDPADFLAHSKNYDREAAAFRNRKVYDSGNSSHVRVHPSLKDITDFVITGRFPEILTQMARARVAVTPRTAWSGFPVKLVNYLAAGLPVVASFGSVRYMVHYEGIEIVKHPTPVDFAAPIINILTSSGKADELSGKALETARKHYSWETVGPILGNVYDMLLQKRKPGTTTERERHI